MAAVSKSKGDSVFDGTVAYMTIIATVLCSGTVANSKARTSQLLLQTVHDPTNCMQKFAHLLIKSEKRVFISRSGRST
jgi:hypothetical protein